MVKFWLASLAMLWCGAEILAGDAAGVYQVGTAKVDITPDYPVRLAGYAGRRDEVDRVAQKIHVRAIAIGDDSTGGAVLMINVETCGFPADLVTNVCRELKEKTGIPRERIAVCSTHTHSAPWVVGYAPFISVDPLPEAHRKHLEQFRKELEAKIVQVGLQALKDQQPATLSWGRGKVGFAANRRVLQEGKWRGFGVQPDRPTDHRLPMLVAKNEQGVPIAVLVGYACHCTTLGGGYMEIAGDWAGFAQEFLEQDFPQATAMVIIGCGADANPEPRGKFEFCRQHGQAVREEVGRLLKGELKPVTGPVRCKFDEVELPLGDIPGREQWEQQVKRGGSAGQLAKYFLQMLDQGKEIPKTVTYPVGTWTFGESLGFIFLGGEVVVDYAIRVDRDFDPDRLWVVAYANDVPCYIPSKRILREGGYEADSSMIFYAKPTRFAPEVEDMVIDTIQRLLPHSYYSKEKQRDLPPAKDPEQARRSMRVPPDMRVELVAAEPLIVDPVAFDWGPDGSLWVVEMRDYPNGMDGRGEPGGRIKRLVDRDGDGRYDESTIYADRLVFPTGVKVWRSGILVTAAPEILYFEDRDGDGKADHKEVLYRGFGEGNQQHRVNGLKFGIDNWIYVGNGDSGGNIVSLKTGTKIGVRGRDLRIKPDTGEIETQSGQTQYGRCQDDWGNWFGGNNSLPIWHYVLDEQYLRRNPHLRSGSVRRDISVPPGAAPVYPASRTLVRFNDFDKVDRFTSACSPIIYRDRLLGEKYYESVFVCEPVHDLVYRGVMKPEGYSFRVTRAAEQKASEFFASEDNWSRPVMVRTGPDGALWVADMYRFVIEHPQWIPWQWQRKLDVRGGENRGRIYRVVPKDGQARPFPKLSDKTPDEWVQALESPNSWVRETAQQLILWRGDADVVAALIDLVRQSTLPQARLHALYTLDGLGKLDRETLLISLKDSHPAVVRHAVRLSERWLDGDESIRGAVLALGEPEDAQLRMQLAYSLGACRDAAASRLLARLLVRFGEDSWFRRAAMSSLREDSIRDVVLYVVRASDERGLTSLLAELLEQSAAFGSREGATAIFESVVPAETATESSIAALAGVLDAISRARKGYAALLSDRARQRVAALLSGARAAVESPDSDESLRLAAIRLLCRDSRQVGADIEVLQELLQPQVSAPLQQAAVARLRQVGSKRTPEALLAYWKGLSPSMRDRILDALFSRTTWTSALLDRVEAGEIAVADLGAARVSMLRSHGSAELRARAEKLFAGKVNQDRVKVIVQVAEAMQDLQGDVAKGKQVFEKRCSTCHQLEGVGNAIGPDLLTLTNRSTEFLLTAIFDPNRALEDRFQSYLAATTDGRVTSGLLLAEAANSVTLVDQEGKQHIILRSELEQLASTGKSLMPEGLEKDLSVDDVADVVAYLQSFKPTPKSFPGNEPQVAPLRDDGSFRLFAIHARIYGPSLVFESEFRNLGFWQSERDVAAWDVNVIKPGKYNVSVVYACAPTAAGNRYVFTIGGRSLTGEISSSGGWDRYTSRAMGTVELEPGKTEAVFRSDGPVRGALCDLKVIRLIPAGK